MTSMVDLAAELGAGQPAEKNGSLWLTIPAPDVRRMAAAMDRRCARLVTISSSQLPENAGIALRYHWDLDNQLISVDTVAGAGSIASIRDICPAADWVEREIHEYFAMNFEGADYAPLMLRHGDAVGVNLREEDE